MLSKNSNKNNKLVTEFFMKDINEPSTSELAINEESSKNEIIKKETSTTQKSENKKNTGISSQMQLLGLAKNFVLASRRQNTKKSTYFCIAKTTKS